MIGDFHTSQEHKTLSALPKVISFPILSEIIPDLALMFICP